MPNIDTEPIETPSDDITLCTSCNCMTHTVDGKCGKCNAAKVETPSELEQKIHKVIRYIFIEGVKQGASEALFNKSENAGDVAVEGSSRVRRLIADEVRKAEIRGASKAANSINNELGLELSTNGEHYLVQPHPTEKEGV